MKLAELSTDQALDALCELTPYISNIMEDEQVLSALDGAMQRSVAAEQGDRSGEQENAPLAGIRMISGMAKNIPLLLKTHRPDVYGILSVLNERTVSEIAAQSVKDTIRQVREALQDNDLVDFFKSSVRAEQSEQSAPSASSLASV